jgi:branched-chain amino acid transport system permease protein
VTVIVEAVITGLLTGGVYALMASGLALVYGVMDIINIAQGIFIVLGAYLSYVLEQRLQLDLFLGLFITIPVMFALGVAIEWTLVRRLDKDRSMFSILIMFGIALIIEGMLNFLFGANYVQLHAWYIDASFHIAGFYLAYIYIFAFVASVILLAGLYLLVYRTKFGYGLRASMQDRTAAALIGIDVERVQAITFGIGVALAAAGGAAFGATNVFNAASSYDLITRLLVIIVLGGMGSLRGALVGSLIMLVVGNVVAVVWSPIWSTTLFFVLLIVLLLVRPQGLFGLQMGRKQ